MRDHLLCIATIYQLKSSQKYLSFIKLKLAEIDHVMHLFVGCSEEQSALEQIFVR